MGKRAKPEEIIVKLREVGVRQRLLSPRLCVCR